MFKKVSVLCSVFLAVFAVVATAATKDSGSVPFFDKVKGEVVIPALPNGAEILFVEIYDDVKGVKPHKISARKESDGYRFSLDLTAGFNYQFCLNGKNFWQEVALDSKVGDGITPDCSWKDAQGVPRCKYARPLGQ